MLEKKWKDSKQQSVSDCDRIRDDKRQIWLRLPASEPSLHIFLSHCALFEYTKTVTEKAGEKKNERNENCRRQSSNGWERDRQTDEASVEHVKLMNTDYESIYTQTHYKNVSAAAERLSHFEKLSIKIYFLSVVPYLVGSDAMVCELCQHKRQTRQKNRKKGTKNRRRRR